MDKQKLYWMEGLAKKGVLCDLIATVAAAITCTELFVPLYRCEDVWPAQYKFFCTNYYYVFTNYIVFSTLG